MVEKIRNFLNVFICSYVWSSGKKRIPHQIIDQFFSLISTYLRNKLTRELGEAANKMKTDLLLL